MKFSKILFSRYAAAAVALCAAVTVTSCAEMDLVSDAGSGLLNVSGAVYDYDTEAAISGIKVILGVYDEDDLNNKYPLQTSETISGADGSFSLSVTMMGGCIYQLNAIDIDGDNKHYWFEKQKLNIDFSGQGYDTETDTYTLENMWLYGKGME